ncbi:hypothetical protein [Desulfurobacterium atlanticum]|uniref:Roadblock/LAMTOR2 domain-containing protein n=1 Tax=Desulfurobacterium atlanticum TaxID=240169 RepID=A0A238YUV5_9BACT|nr:hypothetical protein [Desulfurobacterium atlanticum]SNR74732.1 hypothetical protein SAMN06265340_10511 [Desulfurobacterium atlanticum]
MGIAQKAMDEIPFISGYAAVRFSGEVIDSAGESVSEIIGSVQKVVEEYLKMYRILGEYSVGIPKEILMSTTELFILVRVYYNEEVFQVAVLKSDANLGYTRFMLQQYLKELV